MDKTQQRYFTVWLISITVITLFYIIFCLTCDSDVYNIFDNVDNYRPYFRQMTPMYPPPLTNFGGPSDVFNTNYYSN